jgi:hypothetical protein
MRHDLFLSTVSALAVCTVTSLAGGQTPEVIYTEIPTSSTSDVPGAVDAGGSPVATKWKSIEDLRVSPDGTQWVLKGRNQLGSLDEGTVMLGSGTSGTMFMQEGQPFEGGVAGELYDFFDSRSPASFNTAGDIGFSARARNGVAGTLEKVVFYDATLTTHTIVIQQGDLLSGTSDDPGNTIGDETLGNSVGSVQLLDNGEISYAVTPIGNCHSNYYPGYFRDDTMWRQSNVSPVTTLGIGATVYDSIDFDESGTTPDGLHWFIKGDAEGEGTGSNRILVIDGTVVMQESFQINGTGPVFGEVFQTQMTSNGTWIARGRDDVSDVWVVHDGTLVLETGDSVGVDQVGVSVSAVTCNGVGDWVAVCNTTAPDATDDVVLLNGEVVLREGDPIDVDGNGMFDDGAFLGRGNLTSSTFAANDFYLTDSRMLYFIANLHDGAGNDLESTSGFSSPNAFLRMQLTSQTFCDDSDGASASCPCAAGSPASGCELPQGTGGVALSLVSQQTSPLNRVTLAGSGFPTMGTPGAVVIRSTSLDTGSPIVFGDGLRCVGNPVVRLGATLASGGASTHTFGHGAMAGTGNFYYQVWFRSTPISFCDPIAAFNLSNGRVLAW